MSFYWDDELKSIAEVGTIEKDMSLRIPHSCMIVDM